MLNWYLEGDFIDDTQIRNILAEKKIVLFGASEKNRYLIDVLGKERVQCIFDNDENKWDTEKDGVPIIKPCAGLEDIILVSAVYDWTNISNQIKSLGYQEIYFYLSDEIEPNLFQYQAVFAPQKQRNMIVMEKKYKYIHIIMDEKFFSALIEMIAYQFQMDEHFFVVYNINQSNENDIYGLWNTYINIQKQYKNIYLVHDTDYPNLYNWDANKDKLEYLLNESDKIIFHGEYLSPRLGAFFGSNRKLLNEKGMFLPWGRIGNQPYADGYMEEVFQYVKVIVCQDFATIEFIQKNYPITHKAIWIKNGPSYARLTKNIPVRNKTKNIFISHCANEYGKAIENLKYLRDMKGLYKLYAITSYGEQKKQVEEYGKKYFGDRFIAVEDYMDYQEYVEFLSKMDIAILGMDLMAGRDTLELLFWAGVKVYLKPGTAIDKRIKSMGYKVNDYYQVLQETEEELFHNPDEDWNRMIASREFDAEKKAEQWKKLFEFNMEEKDKKYDTV